MPFDALVTFTKNEAQVPVILSFRGENAFLSNFALAEVRFKGRVYPATENAYFAWRTASEEYREALQAMRPRDAKGFSRTPGYMATERPLVTPITRVLAMASFVRQKFFNHPELGDKLLATGDAALIEGNTWGDQLFGFDMIACKGANALGQICMAVRTELRAARGG